MLQDLYVRDKLREMSKDASQRAYIPSEAPASKALWPAARSLGRFLCHLGEKLQQTGVPSEPGGRSARPQTLRLRSGSR